MGVGSGFGVEGSGCRAWGAGYAVGCVGFRVWGVCSGLDVNDFGCGARG